jgi:hypothetical protein
LRHYNNNKNKKHKKTRKTQISERKTNNKKITETKRKITNKNIERNPDENNTGH